MNSKITIGIIIIAITIGIYAVMSIDYTTEDVVSTETPITGNDNEADYFINESGEKTFVIGVGDSPVIGD